MLRGKSNKYLFYCLWFDPIPAQTHDLYLSGSPKASTLTITPPMGFTNVTMCCQNFTIITMSNTNIVNKVGSQKVQYVQEKTMQSK
jgi:hypothetical protein